MEKEYHQPRGRYRSLEHRKYPQDVVWKCTIAALGQSFNGEEIYSTTKKISLTKKLSCVLAEIRGSAYA